LSLQGGPEHPLFFKRVERLMSDADYASTTVSQTIRGIALGLGAIIYPVIVTEPDKHSIVKDYATPLALASLCGVVAIVLDAVHYFVSDDYARSELDRLSKLYKSGQVSDPAQFMGSPNSRPNKFIAGFFWAKIVFTGIGAAVVAGVVISGLGFSH
jgi:hypothetical protein